MGGKDLQDLHQLSRAPVHSLWRRLTRPDGPRVKRANTLASQYPALAAFASTRSLRWVVEYLQYRFGRRHPFQVYPAGETGVYPLRGDGGGEVRVALAGDWGTGTDEAAEVAARMREFTPHVTVHLGDVYYMGDAVEVAENFLGEKAEDSRFTPIAWPNGSRGSFSLIGNHEMYARGIAYFKRMLPKLGVIENGRPQGQRASFFCLENEHWRVIALDTGYNSVGWPFIEYLLPADCALPKPLMDWLAGVLAGGDDGRGIILLSHHQYYSAFEARYPKPAAQLSAFFKRPVLWFWGHEHRMAIYDKYAIDGNLEAHGRCLGHGGMPVDLPPAGPLHPECPVLFADARHYPNDENLRIGMNGFARLTFKGPSLHVEYADLHGDSVYVEDFAVRGGALLRIGGGAV